MDRAVLIANPAASQFSGGVHRSAQRILRRRYDLEVVWPNNADHARQISADAVSDGVALIVAVGGDGIVHHVAQPIVGSQSTLGIVPVGTTNVVARLLGLPHRPTAALKLLASNHMVIPAPVMRVAMVSEGSELIRHALFSMGIGVDAEVVLRAEAEPYRKYSFGGLHYARTAMSVVWSDLRHREAEITVTSAAGTVTGIGAMAQIHPIYSYFGKSALTLDDEMPDPLSVLVIERLPIRRTPSVLWAAIRSGLGGVPGMTLLRRPAIDIATLERPLPAQLDGELIPDVTRAQITVIPEGIRIAGPHPSRR